MVIWLRLTLSSLEFWSANASWACVSWNSPRVLCTCSPWSDRSVVPTLIGWRIHISSSSLGAMPRRLVFALGLALLAPSTPAQAAEPIMPLSEVRSGMDCTGLSVVRGTAISEFDVEVIDVVAGGPPSATRILIRVSGPAVDATGVGQGFSGSPVLCDDGSGARRTAGAVSESVGEYGNKMALATPIETMLGARPDAPRGRSSAAERRAGAALWAFGHQLDAFGARSLMLTDAYVFSVVNNPLGLPEISTYKLAAPGHVQGSVTNDT